jgi:hypothetical protein
VAWGFPDSRAGAFGSVRSRRIHRSPAVSSCARTYSGQRSARISGPPGPLIPVAPVVQVPQERRPVREVSCGYPSAGTVITLTAQISGGLWVRQTMVGALGCLPVGPRHFRLFPDRVLSWC